MTRISISLAGLGTLALLCGVTVGTSALAAEGASAAEEGKEIAYSRRKGNCLACHMMDDGESPGTLGPPLVAMQVRYPDKAKLRAQIYDPTVANAESAMPPFGKHEILTEDELDKVVEYVWTL
jgi:sulfur-oxidizing protein SoxX